MSYETKDKMVSHPSHYQLPNGMEVIDIIEGATQDLSGIEAVDTANALKYILRWKKKNGRQDIEKAIWYLTHLKDVLEVDDFYIPEVKETPAPDRLVVGVERNLYNVLIGIMSDGQKFELHKDDKDNYYYLKLTDNYGERVYVEFEEGLLERWKTVGRL